jgi:hypothetical protein
MRVQVHYGSPPPCERTRAIARLLAGILYIIQTNVGVDSRLYRTKKPATIAGFK